MNNRDLSLDVELTAVSVERDAKYLACAPEHILRKSRSEIESAREHLNDALAKIDRRIAA